MKATSRERFLFLLRYARQYKRLVTLQFVLMGLSVGFGLLTPWPLKILVDNVVGGKPFVIGSWQPAFATGILLLLTCLAYLVFHAGNSLIQVGSAYVATQSSSRMVRDLRSDLMNRLQALSLRFHDTHKVGDLSYRVTYNTSAVETAFQSGFMGLVKSVVTLIGIFVIMLFMNALLTLVAVVIVPLLIATIRWYARHIHRASLEHQNQEGEVSSFVQEVLSSIRLVRAFTREPIERRRFAAVSGKSVDTRLKTTLVQRSFGFCTAFIFATGTALLFYVGIRQVLAGNLTIGEFLVFNAYLGMLYAPLSVLSYTASSVQSALGGGARLFEILDAPPDVVDRPESSPLQEIRRSIRFESVDFGYEPARLVLHDIDFEIHCGEKVALVGETGGGKSTFLALLLRFYDPDAGRILLDDTDIRDLTLSSLRRHVSYVPQEPILIAGSIRDNIAYANPDASMDDVVAAAQWAEADDFIRKLPDGYDTLVGERGVRLSVGQRQRVSLSRALLRDASILLFDEPTSALDTETEARIVRRLDGFGADRILLIAAHRLSTVRHMNRIVVVSNGRIVEAGSHDDLLATGGAYARLWHAQMEGLPAPAERPT